MEQQEQGKGRILVVDDEAPVGKILRDWLTRKGYYVRQALNFEEVCRALAEEPFDLVTLDIMMPGVDGLEVLRWLRQHHPDLGVIMATALGDLSLVIEAMRLGAINYLIKPFKMELITAEIERGMERQRLIAENRSYQRELERKVEERTRQLQEAHARLERQVRELKGRDRLVRFQMAVHSFEEACAEVLEVLEQVLGIDCAVLYRPDNPNTRLEAVAERGTSISNRLLPLSAKDALPVQAFATQKAVQGTGGELAVPLVYREEVLGVLWIGSLPTGETPAEEVLATLERLSSEAALVLRGALVAEDLERGTLFLGDLEKLE